MIASAAKHPSTVARRMRLHRARKHAAPRCLTLEVRETVIADLVRNALLRADRQNDDKAIRDASYSLLDRSLNNRM